MSSQHPFPKLAEGAWAVACAHVRTGIVCLPDGRLPGPDDPRCQVFESRATAETFAAALIHEHPDIECWLYDHTGSPVTLIRDEAFVERIGSTPRIRPSRWVRLWRWLFGATGPAS